MENVNPFTQISESGYILSDDTKSLLLELADNYNDEPDIFNRINSISQNYDYEHRLSILLLYLDYALTDNLISVDEFMFIQNLKKAFKIIKGDLYEKKYNDIRRILAIQFHLYFLDNSIDFKESHEIGYLQEIFDLDSTQLTIFELLERNH